MISVKVADENVIDPAVSYLVAKHLDLCGFSTIYQK
jgi:hypothetical protein